MTEQLQIYNGDNLSPLELIKYIIEISRLHMTSASTPLHRGMEVSCTMARTSDGRQRGSRYRESEKAQKDRMERFQRRKKDYKALSPEGKGIFNQSMLDAFRSVIQGDDGLKVPNPVDFQGNAEAAA
jgi:hypothetical protein